MSSLPSWQRSRAEPEDSTIEIAALTGALNCRVLSEVRMSQQNPTLIRILAAHAGVFWLLQFASIVHADDTFHERIAPVLEQRCLECHRGIAARGKLSMASLEDLLRGGESGPAIVVGKPEESLILDYISGDEPLMPKDGEPLAASEVAALEEWIRAGAPWPEGVTLQARSAEGKPWWSLAPLERPTVPQPTADAGWARTPIDSFVLEKLAAAGLKPAPEADRSTLIRRLTYDLHGLPPTPAEVAAFVDDPDPLAYEKLVDRLLAAPRYGERWARHWLDVVHFGESHGYDKDKKRNHAWPYRDYVIGALNDDRPYSQFVAEQVAGDILRPGELEGVVATGFITAGPWDFVGHVELREGTADKLKTRAIDRDDMVATTMSTFNSLTAHCARCHDHPFDPIPQAEYYQLQAVFAGVDRGDRNCDSPELKQQRAELTAQRDTARQKVDAAKAEAGETKSETVLQLEAELATCESALAALPAPQLVYAAIPIDARPVHVLHRGDVEQPHDEVAPGALSALAGIERQFVLSDAANEGERRVALARWLTSKENVLTWRSIVNRAWHYHFGRGLVDTPNDFGRNGSRPSHPELLDWLAVEFRDGGQSLKALHRLMVTSAVYRQSSRDDAQARKADADNRLLWRMSRRRLEAEEVRDTLLAVSGKLDTTMGGPSFELFAFEDDHSPRYQYVEMDRPEVFRRTIYSRAVRSVPNPWLEALDCPDPSLSAPVRTTTITALQALALLNNPFVVRQAEYLAERLETEADSAESRIERAYQLVLGRPPRETELTAMVEYATRFDMANACRVLLNTNEFVFVE